MSKPKGVLFWQLYANVYDLVRFLPPYKNMLQDVKNAAGIKMNGKVLDAGCGSGNFIKLIGKERKVNFLGLDISDIMLEKAKKKLQNVSEVKLIQGSLDNKLEFTNGYFDCIVAINSIYAVKDPEYTFSELMRVLKPKGTLVIVNPHAQAKFLTTYLQILGSGKGLQKVSLFFITLPLFFFNLIIKMKASNKAYHFLSQNDWKKIIKSFSIESLDIKETYMQSYLLRLIKK